MYLYIHIFLYKFTYLHILIYIDIYIYCLTGERRLQPSERPLEVALNSRLTPRLVVRVEGTCLEDTSRRSRPRTRREGRHRAASHPPPPSDTREVLQNHINRRREIGERLVDAHTHVEVVGGVQTRPVIIMPARNALSDNRGAQHRAKVSLDVGKAAENGKRRSDSQSTDGDKTPTPRTPSKSSSSRRRKKSRSRDSSLERDSSATSRGRSGSRGSLFNKTFSLRKREEEAAAQTELSTDKSAPGVLKIFGDSISPGAQYKSVLAVPTSTAQELVKEALERYSIARRKSAQFLLCDVIGKFSESEENPDKGTWLEECIRIIGDNERPLILQNYWKPAEGYSRRFELRRRTDLLAMEDIDTTTSGVNANARRMLLTKTRGEVPSDVTWGTLHKSSSCHFDDPTTSLDLISHMSRAHVSKSHDDLSSPAPDDVSDNLGVVEKTDLPPPPTHMPIPRDCPYLITLLSHDCDTDRLVYLLREPVTMVAGDKQGLNESDIYLPAPDLLNPHCWLQYTTSNTTTTTTTTTTTDSQSQGHDQGVKEIYIDPVEGARIAVNNALIVTRIPLKSGDVISVGNHYVFLYKNPRAEPTGSSKLSLSKVAVSAREVTNTDSAVPRGKHTPQTPEPAEARQWRMRKNSEYEAEQTRLKLSFLAGKEKELIERVTRVCETYPNGYKLSPAYLLLMTLDYSAVKYPQTHTRTLLLQIATTVQNIVWVTSLRHIRVVRNKVIES